MKKTSEQIVTRVQLETIYTAWGSCAEIPKRGNKAVVAWPNKTHAEISPHKSTGDYAGAMYKIEFFSH